MSRAACVDRDAPRAAPSVDEKQVPCLHAPDVAFHAYDRKQPRLGLVEPRYGMLFISRQSFAPGRHEFLISAKGYQPVRCEVEVVTDKLVEIRVELFRQ